MTFSDLKLAEPILQAVTKEKYASPSPIQREAIPHLLAGKDLFGCAQTGTGKTAAFALPIVQKLFESRESGKRRVPKALVLAPTRELATQVCNSFNAYGKFSGVRAIAIFGGVSQRPQVAALRNGVDVLVATPGRLVDLINQKLCDLRSIATLVLDEADHMLDLGFIHDVKTIIAKVPKNRQTLMFSATLPTAIASLAADILRDPVNVSVAPVSTPVESVAQSLYHVNKLDKGGLLVGLLRDDGIQASLVFSRTKHGADKICKMLNAAGIRARAIHGNKTQAARQEALAAFKKGAVRVLVATDIAARGIDIHGLSHVVNYDLPDVPETYVHRIGRTGRAGRSGVAISFCDAAEHSSLRDIERLIKTRISVIHDHPFAVPGPKHVSQPSRQNRDAKAATPYAKPQKRRGQDGRHPISQAPSRFQGFKTRDGSRMRKNVRHGSPVRNAAS